MSTPLDLNSEILLLILRIGALREEIAKPEPLPWELSDLALLDNATQGLHLIRDHALQCVRAEGRSWAAISTATGVPATTWRGRFDRHIRGVEQS